MRKNSTKMITALMVCIFAYIILSGFYDDRGLTVRRETGTFTLGPAPADTLYIGPLIIATSGYFSFDFVPQDSSAAGGILPKFTAEYALYTRQGNPVFEDTSTALWHPLSTIAGDSMRATFATYEDSAFNAYARSKSKRGQWTAQDIGQKYTVTPAPAYQIFIRVISTITPITDAGSAIITGYWEFFAQ